MITNWYSNFKLCKYSNILKLSSNNLDNLTNLNKVLARNIFKDNNTH